MLWFTALMWFMAVQSCADATDKLLHVHTVWRHGGRSPIGPYPNDAYRDYWPQGLGQLTAKEFGLQEGMMQHHHLGKLIRNRYIENTDTKYNYGLDSTYNAQQIYVRCTDVNRTLMSAYSNLAGMYPMGLLNVTYPDDSDWPAQWSPIPVHTVNDHDDYLLNMGTHCPNADAAYDNYVEDSVEWNEMADETEEFRKWLSAELGYDETQGLGGWYDSQDTAYIERLYGLPQPDYLNDTVYERMSNMTYFADDFDYKSYIEGRLRGGPLLTEIVNRMQVISNCYTDFQKEKKVGAGCDWYLSHKYYAYSAHDSTMEAFLNVLGALDEIVDVRASGVPKYASCIALELWACDDGSFYIQAAYQDGWFYNVDDNPKFRMVTNTIEGCPKHCDTCPLDTFVSRSEKYMVNDWYEECYRSPISSKSWTSFWKSDSASYDENDSSWNNAVIVWTIVLLCLSAILNVFLVVGLTVVSRRNKQLKKYNLQCLAAQRHPSMPEDICKT